MSHTHTSFTGETGHEARKTTDVQLATVFACQHLRLVLLWSVKIGSDMSRGVLRPAHVAGGNTEKLSVTINANWLGQVRYLSNDAKAIGSSGQKQG